MIKLAKKCYFRALDVLPLDAAPSAGFKTSLRLIVGPVNAKL
jgi:hypothetical protein